MAVDSGGRNDKRQRRALQRLAANAIDTLSLIEGDGISFSGDQINVDLGSNPGLAVSSSGLTVDLRDTDPGLELAASGLGVLLAASDPGLTVTGGLAVAIASGAPFGLTGGLSLTLTADGGLQTASSALGIKLDTNPGLALSANGLTVDLTTSSGLELTATGLQADLKADGGLQTLTNELGIKLQSSSGLDLTASGLAIDPGSELEINAGNEVNHAYPPGRFTSIDDGSTAYTLEQVSAGDLILVDSAVSTSQSVRLPDPSTCTGEHITLKNVGDDAVTFLIIAQYLNDYTGLIEGIAANASGSSFITVAVPKGAYTVTSDGSGWWFTSAYLAYQDVQWQRYEITEATLANKSGATADITLISLSANVLNNVIFERCFIHERQGWFTANSGVLDVEIVLDDDNSGTTRTLHTSYQLYPTSVTGLTGRSAIQQSDFVATGDVEVRAEFTVSGGTTDINDVAQGRSTVWIQWGNIGPAFA